MKISNPFAKKKGKSKAVTSRNSKSKKTKPKNKKILAYFGIIAVLFVTSVTYGCYAMYQREALKAEAGSWTYLSEKSASVRWVRACKKYINAYGGVYNVTVHAYRNNSNVRKMTLYTYRQEGNATVSKSVVRQESWLYGVVAGADINASTYFRDTVEIYVDTAGWVTYLGSQSINPAKLANC